MLSAQETSTSSEIKAPAPEATGTRRRVADCHRCGWRLELRRMDRPHSLVASLLGLGRPWLCEECIADLEGTGEVTRRDPAFARDEADAASSHRFVA